MKNMKNMEKGIRLISVLLLLGLFFYGFNEYVINKNIYDGKKIEKTVFKDDNIFLNNVNQNLYSGNYKKVIDLLINKEYKNSKEKRILIRAYLEYGHHSDAEKKYLQNASKLLSELESKDFNYFYLKGYSYEVIRDYDNAFINYQLGLDKVGKSIDKALILNQIGYLYEMKGEVIKAYNFYYKSYIEKETFNSSFNIGRMLMLNDKIGDSEKYFLYALNTKNNEFKSTIYYMLSRLFIYKNNYEKALLYANKSIDIDSNYFIGYVGLAKVLLSENTINDTLKIKTLLEKSIYLYNNSYESYLLLARLEYYNNGYTSLFLKYLKKSSEVIEKNTFLTDVKRKEINIYINIFNIFSKLIGEVGDDKNNFIDAISILQKNNSYKNFIIEEINDWNYGIFIKYKGTQIIKNFKNAE